MYDKSIWQLDMKRLKKELSKDVRLESVEISHEKVGKWILKWRKKLLYYAQIGDRIYLMDKKEKYLDISMRERKCLCLFLVSSDGKNVSSLIEVLSIYRNMLSMILSLKFMKWTVTELILF